MSDDWQDAAFTSRHMHKRSSRGSRSSKSSTAFDVRKTFGEYELKCPAWQKLDHVSTDSATPVLELYRLTEDGLGVVGELRLPDAMHAAVVLAGSREGLRRVMEGLEGAGASSGGRAHDEDEDDEDEDEDDDDDDDGPDRFETFEKNSFRNPKFWVRWRAIPPPPKPKKWKKLRRYTKKSDGDDEMGEEDLDAEDDKEDNAAAAMVKEGGMGYIVFTGNLCRKFKGTLSCAELGWKDVAITGFKEVGRSESDTRVMWGDVEM